MVGGEGDKGQGAHSPHCCPCCVCTPRAHSYSPTLVCNPHTRLYPHVLICTPPRTLRTCLHSFVAAAAVGVGAPAVSAMLAPALFVLVHATRLHAFGLYLCSLVFVRTPLGSFICIKCKVSIHHN